MIKKTFSVIGLKCMNCNANVERTLKTLFGVAGDVVNLEEANVIVDYDETQVNPQAMKDSVDYL